MGKLRSKTNHRPTKHNGVTLGEPLVVLADGTLPPEGANIADGTLSPEGANIADCFWQWDDGAFPTGELLEDGTLVPDVPVDAPGNPKPGKP